MVSTPPKRATQVKSTCVHSLPTIQAIQVNQEMSVVFTPEMFALLDSKTKQKMLAVASGTVNEKPKKVLSPEHLAKLKAGREAAAAKKAAEKATAPAEPVEAAEVAAPVADAKEPKAKKVLSPEHLAKLKAGREAAAAKKAAEKAAAAPAPAEPVEAAEVAVAAPVADAKEPKAKKVLSPEHLAKLKAGREAAKAKKEAEKAAAVAAPAPAPAPVKVVLNPEEEDDVAEPVAVAAPVAEAKAKKVLSPEHLAKLKAGREAAKAKKEAAKAELVAVSIAAELVGHGEVPESVIEAAAAAVADAKPKKVLSPEHLAKLKAGREAAKAKKAAEKALSEAQSSRSSSPKQKSD